MYLGQNTQQYPVVHSGELAGGGSLAVAVGVSDMQHTTYMIPDRTGDMRHVA